MDNVVFGRENVSQIRSPLHGNGICATKPIFAGDMIFCELPSLFLQTIPNKQDVLVCSNCARFVGSYGTQLSLLTREAQRQQYLYDSQNFEGDATLSSIIPCFHQCGEVYCSDKCRNIHYHNGHSLCCTGQISEEDAAEHSLIQFKQHAVETNEIFLLVGDLFARVCARSDAAEGELKCEAVRSVLEPYECFVRHAWWEVALVNNGNCTAAEQDNLRRTLYRLVQESWGMLNRALCLEERGLAGLLSAEYMARTIGMFEQNNVGVRLSNPLVEYIECLDKESPAVKEVLMSANLIASCIEAEASMCEDEDEEEVDEVDVVDVTCSMDTPQEQKVDEEEEMSDEDNSDYSTLRSLVEEVGVECMFPPLDGTAFYTTICKINHSCVPNVLVQYTSHAEYGLCAMIVALRDIAEGEELVQSYIDQTLDTEERQTLLRDYGFRCTCERCVADSSNTVSQSTVPNLSFCQSCN
mmetsp:Transcript_16855/g.25350  ORF Transcript_16855/g.25350 Transcript_16855/m.25350 type:complete len:468 (-) Transcript_16855:7-1410(-)